MRRWDNKLDSQTIQARDETLPFLHPTGNFDFPHSPLTRPLIRGFFWIATAIFGFGQAWSHRFAISPDGNNYLDIAAAYLRGDFAHAINAYWSPMYSWLLAACFWVFNPSGYRETTLLHLLDFAGLLIALRCFEYFFTAFLAFLKRSEPSHEETNAGETFWWVLGYGLFFSTSLFVLTMEPTTPDVWVGVITYLAMGILLRITMQPQRLANFAFLGLVVGLGYLTKSFYFPLAFLLLAVAGLSAILSRRTLAGVLLAFLGFALIGGPFIFEISKAKNRFSFGDVGKIGYAEAVNPLVQPFFWRGENQTGVPIHTTRQILSAPRVFEFAAPVGGSYPPSYDMSYWLDGIRPHFNIRGQLRIVRRSVGTFFLVFVTQIEFAVGFLVLWFYRRNRTECLSFVARLWPLWVPPSLACVAYSFVLVEPRYIAPFLVFLWLAAFAGVARASEVSSRRVVVAVVLAVLSVTGIKAGKYFVSDLAAISNQQNEYWEVAQNLRKLGVEPGDKVSIISGNAVAHWARLAGVKIVAELPSGEDIGFWRADRATQDRVYAAFATTGSRVVVVKDPPPDATRDDWHRLGDTPYYARFLPGSP